jgi:hypothetical protein
MATFEIDGVLPVVPTLFTREGAGLGGAWRFA